MADRADARRTQASAGGSPGLIGSLRALLATLLAMAHTRLELLGVEVREEFARIGQILMWACVGLLFFGLGVVFVSLALVMAFWETHRLLILSLLGGGFLALAAFAWRSVVALTQEKPRMFEASLGELERDRDKLAGRK